MNISRKFVVWKLQQPIKQKVSVISFLMSLRPGVLTGPFLLAYICVYYRISSNISEGLVQAHTAFLFHPNFWGLAFLTDLISLLTRWS
jgi:hypothetical protein